MGKHLFKVELKTSFLKIFYFQTSSKEVVFSVSQRPTPEALHSVLPLGEDVCSGDICGAQVSSVKSLLYQKN